MTRLLLGQGLPRSAAKLLSACGASRKSLRRTGTYDSDQGEIWEDVSHKLSSLNVHSATASMGDAYEERAAAIEEYIAALQRFQAVGKGEQLRRWGLEPRHRSLATVSFRGNQGSGTRVSDEIWISEHASEQASRRGLSETTVREVARAPEQRMAIRPGREIRQSRIAMPAGGKLYLVRVVVDTGPQTDTVVTAYRTSRIDKYWSA